MNDKKVSIIIVNWNGKEVLAECLEGLLRQTYNDYCVTVTDNGSIDGSVDFIKGTYPDINVIALSKNHGFSKGNNIALKEVKTEYVAFLNNDAIPDILWLASLVKTLDATPDAGFAASKMLFYDDPETIDRVGDAYTKAGIASLRGRGDSASRHMKQEWIFGACAGAAIYRVDMLKDIGYFDEDFFLIHEDVDLSFRAQLKGYKCLYVPDAIVYHKTSKSIVHDSPVSVYYGHRNLEWVYFQNMPKRLLLKTLIPHLIYDILSFFYFLANGRIKPFVKGKRDALRGFSKVFNKRRYIQDDIRVEDKYIWSLFERELYIPRLLRRYKK